jgi:hypothetical protein
MLTTAFAAWLGLVAATASKKTAHLAPNLEVY